MTAIIKSSAIEHVIKEAVEKGGYHGEVPRWNDAFLDPAFWQALGSARGWERKVVVRRGTVIGNFCTPCSEEHPRGECFEEMGFGMDYLDPWAYHWHRFIDHLASGQDAESFFAAL